MSFAGPVSALSPVTPFGELPDERAFADLAALLREITGIALPDSKKALVQARLTKRLRETGAAGFAEYRAVLEGDSPEAEAEREKLISAITTNVTRFFREPHHFEDLRARVLPPLVERVRAGGRLRIWSAGCSSGQEPYSIALTLLDLLPDAASHDVLVLATDLDRSVLETAGKGIYPQASLQEIRDPTHLARFSRSADGFCRVTPDLRALVRFRHLNLVHDFPMRGLFDVVFCRNVVIYFAQETEAAVFRNIAGRMPAGGRLYIGHSERIRPGTGPAFVRDGVTTYRRI